MSNYQQSWDDALSFPITRAILLYNCYSIRNGATVAVSYEDKAIADQMVMNGFDKAISL